MNTSRTTKHAFAIFFTLYAAGCVSQEECTNTCEYAYDGECDDGGDGADYDVCPLGTDCADCGSRGSDPDEESETSDSLCSNSCRYAFDGECDDGGSGAAYDVCALGTDCGDCGTRSGSSSGGSSSSSGSTGSSGGTYQRCAGIEDQLALCLCLSNGDASLCW